MASSLPYYSATSPTPQPGSGPFGAVPGVIPGVTPVTASYTPIPSAVTTGMPDPFGDLSRIYPNLSGTNQAVSGDILSQLAGQLSPSTIAALQNASATFGVGMGTPGSAFGANYGVQSVGQTAEALQQQGLQNYNSILPTVSGTQTVSPSVQANIGEFNAGAQNQVAQANAAQQNQLSQFNAGVGNQANLTNLGVTEQNALDAAAPNPTQSASYAQQLFNQYLAAMRSPAGGTLRMPQNPITGPGWQQTGSELGSYPGSSGSNPYTVYNLGSLGDLAGAYGDQGGGGGDFEDFGF